MSRVASCVDKFLFGPLTTMERAQALRCAIRKITPDGYASCVQLSGHTVFEPYVIIPEGILSNGKQAVVYLRFLDDELRRSPNLNEYLLDRFGQVN